MKPQPSPRTPRPAGRSARPDGAGTALLLEGIDTAAEEALRAAGYRVLTEARALGPAELCTRITELCADAPRKRPAPLGGGGAVLLGIRSKTQVDAEAIAAGGHALTAIGCFCIGVNQVDLSAAAGAGVAVFNAPFSNTRSVAELTIAEIIALHRRLGDQSAAMHRGDWDKSAHGAHEVRGRTLGIVGYGHIGSQLSVLAEALGMRVVFYDIAPKLPLGNARACRSLPELLKAADVVSLHVPATPRTKNLIGAAEVRMMRPGSMLINNARGSVVDLDALAAALGAGRLRGAALDVFPSEPEARGERFQSPVQGLANVILTPHIGGSTREAQASIALDVAGKWLGYLGAGRTTGSVNLPEVELPDTGQAGTHRLTHVHRNVPGVLSKINAVFAKRGINITAQSLRTNERVGYVALDVEAAHAQRAAEELNRLDETIRTRLVR